MCVRVCVFKQYLHTYIHAQAMCFLVCNVHVGVLMVPARTCVCVGALLERALSIINSY